MKSKLKGDSTMLRLTKTIVQKILDLNEGFSRTTGYSSRNYSRDTLYIIKGGKLLIDCTQKTSWADSRTDSFYVADIEQTRRFINKYFELLNLGDLLPRKAGESV